MTNFSQNSRLAAARVSPPGFTQGELFAVAKMLDVDATPEDAPPPNLPPRGADPPQGKPREKPPSKTDPAAGRRAADGDATHCTARRAPRRPTPDGPGSRLSAALGPPGLLPEEDAGAYDLIEAEFFNIISPRNIVEQTWVRELTDGVWEERRLLQAKAVSMKLGRRLGVEATVEAVQGPRLTPLGYGTPPATKASINFMSGNRDAEETYADCAEKIGLTEGDDVAAIYVARLGQLMRIQDAIDRGRRNRSRLLHDIERRREDMAKLARTASERLLEGNGDPKAPDGSDRGVANG